MQIHQNFGGPDDAYDAEHAMMRDQLAPYATLAVLGQAPQVVYPQVAAHLARCQPCRQALAELSDVMILAYGSPLERAQRYPQARLGFLAQANDQPQPSGSTLPGGPGWLIITFSPQLLSELRQPSLAGAARGQRLYRYVQEPSSLQDLHVSIEVFAEDAVGGPGHVQVVVEVPTRSPFDQGGSAVTLRAGETTWAGETDEAGCVDFDTVPLAAIPTLRVEIWPRRE